MEGFNQNKARNKTQTVYEPSRDKASNSSFNNKNKGSELVEEGKQRLNNISSSVENYTDDMMKRVRAKPFISLLIASGIGFILSKFLSK